VRAQLDHADQFGPRWPPPTLFASPHGLTATGQRRSATRQRRRPLSRGHFTPACMTYAQDAADVPKVPVQVARAPAGFRVNAQFSPASNCIVYLVDRPPSLVSAAGATLLGSHRVLVVRSALVRQLISASGRTNLRSNLSPTPHSAFVWQIASRTRHLLFAPSGKRQLHEADWAPDDRAVVLAIADTLNTTLLLRFARGNRLERPEVLHTARLGERVRSLWQP